MFDLFRSREKMVRLFLGALLVVVSLSMLTYLIPSYNSGSSSSDMIVAEIGKDTVTVPEVQQLIQNAMRGRQLPPEILPNYVPSMIEDMITDRAMAYEAERLGFQVSDADLSDAIRQIVPNLFPDGKFVGRDMYAALLAQQNLTIPQFETDLKRQILITRLRNIAVEGTIVTPFEIEQTFRQANQKMKVQYVKLTPDKFRGEAQPTTDEMRAYFQTNAAQYQVPEKRSLTVLIADQAKIEQTITTTDADLERLYSQNQASFRTPERVKVRHILLKTTDRPASEEPKIRAKAEDLLKQIRGGGNFADLAKKNSDDPGSAAKGGELDWVVKGQTVPEFEKTAFSLKPGQTSDLVKTQYGYHIIQVEQHEDARLRPFAEVKTELAAQWKKQRVADLMEAAADRAQSALQKDSAHPEKVAAEFNMDVVQANDVTLGQTIPAIGASPDFDQSVAGLKVSEVSQPVALAGNKIALAVLRNVTPPRPAAFEDVEKDIREKLVNNRVQAIVQTRARELVAKAREMGGDLAKTAKSMGLEAKTSDEVTRTSNIEGLGMASYLQEGFARPDGTIIGPVGMADGTVVAKVLSHVEADMSKLAEQRSTIRDQIKSQKAGDRNRLFQEGLRERLIRDGQIKIHQDVVKRLAANYRG
jgi:peptidyl-prolyl cis-trans isomerase D